MPDPLKRFVAPLVVVLSVVSVSFAQTEIGLDTTRTASWSSFEEAVEHASKSGKKILIDVYAPWCGWCRRMQQEAYVDAKIVTFLDQTFEIARLNVDDSESSLEFMGMTFTPQELGYAFGAEGTPTTIFLDQEGNYITRLPGYVDPSTFYQVITYIGSDAYHTQTLEQFIAQGEKN